MSPPASSEKRSETQLMNPITEVALVTGRELRRSFRSTKGVLLAVLSIAAGAGFSMLFAWLDRVKREKLPPGTDWRAAQEQFFSQWYAPDTGKALSSCPYSLWMMLIATLWLAPWLVALMAFDAASGEMQHRTVCFWTIRVHRASYMIGKGLGAWTAVVAVTLGMNLVRLVLDDSGGSTTEWIKIVTPAGKIGYVPGDALGPLGSDQICYSKAGGSWRIAGVIGGGGGQE